MSDWVQDTVSLYQCSTDMRSGEDTMKRKGYIFGHITFPLIIMKKKLK